MSKDVKNINARITDSQYAWLREYAYRHNISRSEVVRDALQLYMETVGLEEGFWDDIYEYWRKINGNEILVKGIALDGRYFIASSRTPQQKVFHDNHRWGKDATDWEQITVEEAKRILQANTARKGPGNRESV